MRIGLGTGGLQNKLEVLKLFLGLIILYGGGFPWAQDWDWRYFSIALLAFKECIKVSPSKSEYPTTYPDYPGHSAPCPAGVEVTIVPWQGW